jgi:hypothetical protein
MAVPPGAPAPRTRIKFEDLISFQPPQGTLQNQAVPPILTDDQVMSQAQMGMNYGDDELTSLLNVTPLPQDKMRLLLKVLGKVRCRLPCPKCRPQTSLPL